MSKGIFGLIRDVATSLSQRNADQQQATTASTPDSPVISQDTAVVTRPPKRSLLDRALSAVDDIIGTNAKLTVVTVCIDSEPNTVF